MITISLCLIAKNEEYAIKRCLNSIADAVDEIIVVDTGSTDETKKIAQQFNAKVYDFEWIDDFSKARNFCFSKATKEYIFWLDCDDVVPESEKKKLIELKSNLDNSIDALGMDYILFVDENDNVVYSCKRYRLLKREKNFQWVGRIHEFIPVSGKVAMSNISVRHMKDKPYNDRNLKIFKKIIKENKELNTREKLYYANELFDNKLYDKAIRAYNEFLKCTDLRMEDGAAACVKIANCYRLKNNIEDELKYLLKSMEYTIPSSEICCRIGEHFFTKNNFKAATFWYETAIKNKPDANSVEIVNRNFYTWIPFLQLCVCYFQMMDYKKAYEYNEKASKYVPNNLSVVNNRKFFSDFFQQINNK